MGYRVVTVSPLKPFAIANFGLANVVSFEDAKSQVREWFRTSKEVGIESENVRRGIAGTALLREDVSKIEAFWDQGRDKRIAALEERWAEGKIQPALDLHLARQKRRQAHFESACRLEGCGNPHRLGTLYNGVSRAEGRTSHRHGAPLFCGAHVWLRRSLTKEALEKLHKSSANRVRLTD